MLYRAGGRTPDVHIRRSRRRARSERVLSVIGIAVLLVLVPRQTAASQPLDGSRLGGGAASVTRGWAGYLVRTGAGPFAAVEGTWVQPRVVCNRPGSSVAFWVGLGGASRSSDALEQIGTAADCSGSALLSLSAWYQLFPAPPVELPLAVRPGDTISARVAVSAGTVTLALRNLSTGAGFSSELWMRSPETDSAEWIVEAPSMCFSTCAQLPLAAFDRVAFTETSTTVGAHTGTIRDSAWASERLRMATRARKMLAVPSSLFGNGSSFAVFRYPR
jgi:Peptidase A4 family